jgi:hypothetical protein
MRVIEQLKQESAFTSTNRSRHVWAALRGRPSCRTRHNHRIGAAAESRPYKCGLQRTSYPGYLAASPVEEVKRMI